MKKSKIEEKQSEPVKIKLGIMAMKDAKLSIKRGATLPQHQLGWSKWKVQCPLF